MYVNNQLRNVYIHVILVGAASGPVLMLSSSHDFAVYATDRNRNIKFSLGCCLGYDGILALYTSNFAEKHGRQLYPYTIYSH